LSFGENLASVRDAVGRADGIIGSIPGEVLDQAPRLRWVHSPAAGVNNELTPQMRQSDVVLTSSAGNGGIPLAEHAMMLMLMLNRSALRWLEAQQNHVWDRFTHGELNGMTVGIVGLGNAGSDLANKAQAFHMRVLGLRRRTDLPSPGVDQMFHSNDLHTFLGECDFVVVTTPRTPETVGMFDRAAFAAMKSSGYFICISRGGIANDDALHCALLQGQIAGAGLDAHGVEPLPPDSPFWTLPNVIITPHNGATTEKTAQRGRDIVAENLRRFVHGEPLLNVVDKVAGY
jgi:phosphoglycerate dehydrogenase-like enzyme